MQVVPNFSKTPYDFDSFTPIIKMSTVPFGIAVPVDSPYKTFDDFIAAAKKSPGKITQGAWGATSAGAIMGNLIANQLGYSVKYVHANGAAPSMASLLGGHIDSVVSYPPSYMPQLKAGRIRLLVANKKFSEYPDIPTFADYGVKGNFEGWSGIFAPKGVPDEVVSTLIAATQKAMKDPKVLEAFANMNAIVDFRHGPEWIADMQVTYDLMKDAAKQMKK